MHCGMNNAKHPYPKTNQSLAVCCARAVMLGFAAGVILLSGWLMLRSYITAASLWVGGRGVAAQKQADPYALAQDLLRYDGSILVVDIRSRTSYEAGHILHAVHVPFMIEGSTVTNADDVLHALGKLIQGKKSVILYGETQFDERPRAAAAFLGTKRITAKTLAIGWNEWRHFRNLWVPQAAWNTLPLLTEGNEQVRTTPPSAAPPAGYVFPETTPLALP